MTVPGYALGAPVCETDSLILYQATRALDGLPVLLKVPSAPRPAPALLRRLMHEYQLARDLDADLIARPLALEHHSGTVALILEQGPDRTLAALMGSPMNVPSFLRIAIGITTALAEIHSHQLIHKDLKPEHVLLDADGRVWLSGLGIASRLPRERQAPEPPEVIAGTLAYMAPEQTGRMNRSIDSRSDLYALGITFYQMLTGVLPFTAGDPMEWVHCHIARQPVPPNQRVIGLPEPLSKMVMKLLAKTAEERYQSTGGLDADLRNCLVQWEANSRIEGFPLGEHDVTERLLIPEKLYGRKTEIDALLDAFDRVASTGTPEIVLVSGYSGIGKTAVIHELHKALVAPRGLFATGKFDQYQRDIPFATLIQALQTLIRHILGKSETEIAVWRDRLQQTVSHNGQLIVKLIPEVEIIIGKQPPIPELPPQEAQNRFQRVLLRFLAAFAGPAHPLALFLDDLQWLDAATLQLLEQLASGQEVRHLLLIGAYRDNEVGPTHPLMRILDTMRKSGTGVQEMVLTPLGIDEVGALIADSLHCDRERALPLAQLVHEKTGGNPFFVMQFLTVLAEGRLLAFDQGAGRWTWDLAQIRAKGFTDNVVDLMISKLSRLPTTTLAALEQFACLGNVAEIATLTTVSEQSEETLHAALWQAVRAGLIVRQEKTYTFLHDRVQEAAYSLIPEASRAEVHLRIGRLFLAHTPEEKREEAIFEIVGQLNRGAALIVPESEREDLAALNLTAGKRAKASTAYAAALAYFAAGADLLAEDCWERRHELAYSLEINRAECEFLTGAGDSTEQRLTAIFEHAADTVEQAAVACLQIDLYTAQGQNNRAIAAGLDFLQRLGIDCRPHPSAEEVQNEYQRIKVTLKSHTLEAHLARPLMSNPASLATVEVMTKTWPPALFTDANLASLIICKAVSLSLQWGNCDASCFAYVLLGRIAGPRFGDYQAGFRFGQLGYELVERRGLKRFEARTCLCFANSIMPWMKHVQDCHALQGRAFEAANRAGDLLYAAFACNSLNTDLLFAGTPLPQVQSEVEQRLAFVEKSGFGLVMDSIASQLALIRTLRGLTREFGSFDHGQFNELRTEHRFAGNLALAIAACRYWVRKLQARYIAGDYATAIDAESKAQQLLWTAPLAFEEADYHFYGALVQAACCDRAVGDWRLQHFEALTAHHRQLEIWSQNCPANFENRAALVGAEIARIENRFLDAERLYEKAIASARENGFVPNEAVAYEVAADFYRQRGFTKFARTYLTEAAACYARWGANGKVRQLEQRYPQLREMLAPTGTLSTGIQELEILAVVRASQAISGEILLDNLLKTLMRIVLEYAGAEHGYLLLMRNEELLSTAIARVENQNVVMHVRGEPEFTEATLPASILNYVRRSLDKVLLDNATSPNPYSADEYFSGHHPKSLLCFPITKQTKLIGVLYLENDLATHAFTPDRLAILELLAAQAAISLENAVIYEALRQSEERYRRITLGLTDYQYSVRIENDSPVETTQSPTCAIVTGYTAEELAANPHLWLSMVVPEDRDRVRENVQQILAGRDIPPIEHRIRRKDGQTRWVSDTIIPLKDASGNLLAYDGVIKDITDRQRAEEEIRILNQELEQRVVDRTAELQDSQSVLMNIVEDLNEKTAELEQANAKLKEVDKLKSMFIASMSHELRTPLNSIIGFSSIMLNEWTGPLNKEQNVNLTAVLRSGKHLLALINDVIDVSKIEAGKIEAIVEDFDVHDVVIEAVETLKKEIERKGLELIVEVPHVILYADRRRLLQCLLNLLSNATKFTMKGSIGVFTELSTDETMMTIAVEDSGIGIGEDDLGRLFSPFVRFHKPGESVIPGTGLGLYLTQKLLREILHGDILVTSTPGVGSRFTMRVATAVYTIRA